MESYPLLFVLGNLEGEKKMVLEDEALSLTRLKSFFVYSLCSSAGVVVCYDYLIIRKLVSLARS